MKPGTEARLFLYLMYTRGHEMEVDDQLHIPNILTPTESPQYPLVAVEK
jgi:hypothetical protein